MTDGHDPVHPAEPILNFDRVVVERGSRVVLDGLSAEVPRGAVTVVAGPSGAGKTTLLRLCNRLDVPDRGVVRFGGRDVAALDPMALRRKVGMVFQEPVLLPGTVRDNLLVADSRVSDEELGEALERVSLPAGFLDRLGSVLSGGEAQRVCLARTMMTDPQVLLADEPTSALDLTPRLAFERLARRLTRDQGMTVVWVTHDLHQLRRLADHVLVLVDGRLRYDGPVDELDAQPQLRSFLEGRLDHTDEHSPESAGGADAAR